MKNTIPLPIKLFSAFVAIFGLIFAFSSYFNPTPFAPTADMTDPATRLAFYTVGATVLGISLGLFLAIMSNRPKSMALMLIVRVFTALLDLTNALILGLGIGLVASQSIIIILGAASIVKLFKIIQAEEK